MWMCELREVRFADVIQGFEIVCWQVRRSSPFQGYLVGSHACLLRSDA
jgi:hypothetical protein